MLYEPLVLGRAGLYTAYSTDCHALTMCTTQRGLKYRVHYYSVVFVEYSCHKLDIRKIEYPAHYYSVVCIEYRCHTM